MNENEKLERTEQENEVFYDEDAIADETEETTYINDASGGRFVRVSRKTSVRMKRGAFFSMIAVVALICVLLGAYGMHLINESLPPDPDLYPGYVTIPEEAYEAYEELGSRYERAEYLIDYINTYYYREVDEEKLIDGMLHGLVQGLDDPYSKYLNAKEFEELNASYAGEFYGIGVSITDLNNQVYIITPIDNSPAQRAGVRAGDIITHVDGVAYTGEELNSAVAAMRGEEGTTVIVTILHDGVSKDYSFVREKITVETVSAKMLEKNVGYIRISEFETTTARDFKEAFKGMEKRNVKGVVVDLRSNPGGLVDQSIAIADIFLDECVVVYIEDRAGNRNYYPAKSGKTNLPVVFLCDEGTASASEILLAAMKDYGVGELIGTRTFGKGIIQEFGDHFTDGAGISLTILEYFSPAENPIHEIGIEPTIPVDYRNDLSDDDYDEEGYLKYESDAQLQKAVELLTK